MKCMQICPQLSLNATESTHVFVPNPLTPTVAIWVELRSILCQTVLSRHL